MTDPDPTSPISDETAALIERAVRGDLSPADRAELDQLAADDPVVATELERAKREEDAMTTAASLFTQQSDPERMRMAIEQKLKLDHKVNFRIGALAVAVLIVYATLSTPYDGVSWMVLGLPLIPILFFVVRDRFRESAFTRVMADSDSLPAEYQKHLARSRQQIIVGQALIIISVLALAIATVDHALDGAYATALMTAACGLILLWSSWRSVFNRVHQQRYDQFLQGRLTLEELFEKPADSSESESD